jgi:hypothetical protein
MVLLDSYVERDYQMSKEYVTSYLGRDCLQRYQA